MSSETESSSDSQEDIVSCCKCTVSEADKLSICLNCDSHPIVCSGKRCRKRVHRKAEDRINHEWLPYPSWLECQKKVNEAIWPKITDAQRTEDGKNAFFLVDDEKELATGARFSTIYEQQSHRVRIVSVIGSSGTGKSTIMREFSVEESKPLPCGKNLQSTTKGVKSYEGPNNSMIWDTEGQIGKDAGPVINVAIPRLVYAFSDVIVFVFDTPQQTDHYVSHMNEYATVGASGSANFARRPRLIVVLNMIRRDSVPNDRVIATAAWKETCNKEELKKLESNFSSINVVYLPFVDQASKPSIRLFAKQQSILYDLINENLGIEDGTRASQFQMMQCALQVLNSSKETNYDAALDFFQLARGKTTIPSTTAKFIEDYFHQVYAVTKTSTVAATNATVTPYQAWLLAVDRLNRRAFDIYCTTWIRLIHRLPPIAEESKYLDKDVIAQMEIAQQNINALIPCQAHHEFAGVGTVYCCKLAKPHHDRHESTKTWVDNSSGKNITKPCHWDSLPNRKKKPPVLLSLVEKVTSQINELKGKVTHESYKKLHEEQLEAAKEEAKQFPGPHMTCFGCLTLFPSQIRACGHNFCAPCLMESTKECLICGDKREWSYRSMPRYAGIRILSLPGGGARSAVSLASLKVLQHLVYDVPIKSMFDYVIATGMGSLIAVSFISMQKNLDKTLELIEEVGKGFKEVGYSKVPVFGGIYRYATGRKYGDTPLKSALNKQLENNPTFGCFPSMAISVAEGNDLALLSSYVLPEELGRPKNVISFDIIDSVRAAVSGGGLLRPFVVPAEKGGGTLEDGGKLLNDPVCEGLIQASRLFPDHTIDFATSMGTGPTDASLQFLGRDSPTKLSKQPEADWKKLRDGLVVNLPDAAYRVNPPGIGPSSFESYHQMRSISQAHESYFRTLLDPATPEASRLASESWNQLVELSHRSVATMFSLGTLLMKVKTVKENGKVAYKVQLEGSIRPRSFITTSLMTALGDTPFDFSIHSNRNHKELTGSAELVSFEKTQPSSDLSEFRFSLSTTIVKKNFWLSIRCTVGSRALAGPLENPIHISGSPWRMCRSSLKAIPGRRVGDAADTKRAPNLTIRCPIVGNLLKPEKAPIPEAAPIPEKEPIPVKVGDDDNGSGPGHSPGEGDDSNSVGKIGDAEASESDEYFEMSFETASDHSVEQDTQDDEISWANQKTQSSSIPKGEK